jgi:hypothetical protein
MVQQARILVCKDLLGPHGGVGWHVLAGLAAIPYVHLMSTCVGGYVGCNILVCRCKDFDLYLHICFVKTVDCIGADGTLLPPTVITNGKYIQKC